VRHHLLDEAREQLAKDALPADQQGLTVASLRHPLRGNGSSSSASRSTITTRS
jgi:hypothetical protein